MRLCGAELDKGYQEQLGEAPQQQQLPQEQADSLRLNVLHALIDEEIVEQRAAKMNLTATNEEVDAKFAEMKAPYHRGAVPGAAEGEQSDGGRFETRLRRNLTINKLLQ